MCARISCARIVQSAPPKQIFPESAPGFTSIRPSVNTALVASVYNIKCYDTVCTVGFLSAASIIIIIIIKNVGV